MDPLVMTSASPARRRTLALVGVVVLAGCGGGDGSTAEGRTLSVDGLLLIHDLDHRVLFDPATGKLGPPVVGAFSIAPDLTRIVHRQDTATVVVSTVGRAADGTPTITTTASLASAGNTGPNVLDEVPPAFNAQGDRVSGVGWWNPATGDHLASGGLAVSPDGRHHLGSTQVGDGTKLLYDDLEPQMPVAATYFTADGQWLVASDAPNGLAFALTHVPTRTKVLRPEADRPDRGFPLPIDPPTGYRIPYSGSDPRGRLLFLPAGRRGLLMPAACGTPADLQGPIAPITQLSPARLADGDLTPIETPLEALNAVPRETDSDGAPYDGFSFAVLGITPDGAAAIVQHQWYRLVATPTAGCAAWSYVPKTLDVFRVALGGSGALEPQVRARAGAGPGVDAAIASGCAGTKLELPVDPTEPAAFRLRRTGGLQFVSETDWLCGSADETFAAYVGGQGRVAPMPAAWPALDRASLLGPAPTKAAEIYGDARVTTGLCQGPLAGGVTGCLVPLDLWWSRLVVAQVGIELVPRASTGPVVTALSHRVAPPGSVVRVLGYGFGASGTVRLGDVAVEAAAITSWSDKAVAFTMPANAPDLGMVRVTDVAGTASGQRHLWLGRSEPWANAPVVPSGPFVLRQGVNRIAFPGAGAFTPGIRSLDPIFPGGDLETIPQAAGPDHVDVLTPSSPGPTTYPWVTFTSPRGLTFRPLTVQPGLPDAPPWQPIGDVTAVVSPSRFVTSAGVVHLWQRVGAEGVITPGAPDHDWTVTGFAPSQWATGGSGPIFRDGDEVWRASGANLERLTGWSVLAGGVRVPQFTPEITTPFPSNLTAHAVHGDLVVEQLQLLPDSGPTRLALEVSTDRGATFTEVIPPTRNLWTTWSAVVAGPRPGIYGTVSQPDASGALVERVARVTLGGALEVSATLPRTPAGATSCAGGFLAFGNLLLCHDQPARRLYAADVSVADGTWAEVGGAVAGHVSAVFVDAAAGQVRVGTDTGGIWQTADLAAWAQRDQVALGPVALPLEVHALGVLPDGAWVTLAQHPSWSNARFVVRATPPAP